METPGSEDQTRIITRFRELFKGRFTRDEIRKLLETHNWNTDETLDFAFGDSKTVQELINGKTEDYIKKVQCDLNLDDIKKKHILKSTRQFACGDCDNVWWKTVPKRKAVSKCKKCHRSFDAIPVEEEWGKATFVCQECGNEFTGFGQMNATQSKCYKCGAMVYPSHLHPPMLGRPFRRRSNNNHSCDAPDCFNRYGHGHGGHIVCTHPKSREDHDKPRVIIPSTPHVSTGSTVYSLDLDGADVSSACSKPPDLGDIGE